MKKDINKNELKKTLKLETVLDGGINWAGNKKKTSKEKNN